ncbi:DMT family transporter [Candidatus Viridilinea mediisalina]|uniref:EamA family transporter n=1 Tax=Candidatus Viridilinea mediisalina TaxID=2024553 RepID=A0A2A6RHH3_9CHLR|nr:DMT family transporter [Candidatus Viridilinea mediisalina]PDW02462.1 EamA family transporter [Candidatus Viridilinea mediisalina]
MRHRALPYVILFVGVLIASTASILIRFAQDAGVPSLSIAAGRLALAALLLTPLAWVRVGPELRGLSRRDLGLALLSGTCLAFHFATWISSLAFTSVASSVALVATNPLWVGLASLLIFRERLGPLNLFGMAVTLLGTLLIGISDSASSVQPNPTLGNLLALVGAVTVSGYLLIGRSLRRRLSVLAYIYVVYSTAAVILVAWALLAGQPLFGFSPYVYALILAMALGPQLLGHTAFNYALSAISATFVAIAILGEPIGSAILAFFLFDEGFAPLQLTGFLLLLLGIVVASRGEVRLKRPA